MQRKNMTELVITIREKMGRGNFSAMIERGVVNFRLNCGRLFIDDVTKKARIVRRIGHEKGSPIKLFVDLPGNKARLWAWKNNRRIDVKCGDEILIRRVLSPVDDGTVQATGEEFFSLISRNHVLLIKRHGRLRLHVESCSVSSFTVRALTDGSIGWGYHVTSEGDYLLNRSLTRADRAIIREVLALKPDFLCPSFVDSPQVILEARRVCQSDGHSPRLMAKVETPVALENLDDILNVSDGIIIGRDDLGTWLDKEQVRMATHNVIRLCKARGLPVIPASNYFKSLCEGVSFAESDRADLESILSLRPEYLYCNETSVSECWQRILAVAENYGMLSKPVAKGVGDNV
jgi:pyruvate kinase